jgi:hypothetical protein
MTHPYGGVSLSNTRQPLIGVVHSPPDPFRVFFYQGRQRPAIAKLHIDIDSV